MKARSSESGSSSSSSSAPSSSSSSASSSMSVDFFGRAFFGPAERGDTAVLRFVTETRAFPFFGGRRAFCGVCFGAGFHGVQPLASTFIGLFGFARFVCARSLTRFMLPCCKSLPLQSQRRFCCGSYAQYHRVFSVAPQAKHGSASAFLNGITAWRGIARPRGSRGRPPWRSRNP